MTTATPVAPSPVLDDYIRTHIRAQAAWLSRQRGFRSSDREDLEQELALEVLQRWAKYQPARSGIRTFMVQVVDGRVSKLLRERGSQKAQFRERMQSLDERSANRLSTKGRSPQEQLDLKMDVASVVASLPADLREVCRQLMEGDPPESFSRDVLLRLRCRFEAAGMRDYLREKE